MIEEQASLVETMVTQSNNHTENMEVDDPICSHSDQNSQLCMSSAHTSDESPGDSGYESKTSLALDQDETIKRLVVALDKCKPFGVKLNDEELVKSLQEGNVCIFIVSETSSSG